jgi:hypothetical protein
VRTSVEQYSSAVIYHLNKNETLTNINYLRSLITEGKPRIVQNGNLGSIILTANNNKIFFEKMHPSEVRNILFPEKIGGSSSKSKGHEFIIKFKEGHAKAILQYLHPDIKSEKDFYYVFNFYSASYVAGGIKGHINLYLSLLIPKQCTAVSSSMSIQTKGKFLLDDIIPENAPSIAKQFYLQFDTLKRNFSPDSLYLVFKITQDEFKQIEEEMFDISQQCSEGKITYSLLGLNYNSYNCFSVLNLFTNKLGIKKNYLDYFFDWQLDNDDSAQKYALASSRPTHLKKYLEAFLSAVGSMIPKLNEIEKSKYAQDYLLINCDALKSEWPLDKKCTYDNICVITQDGYFSTTYQETKNYFISQDVSTTTSSNSLAPEAIITTIYKLDEQHHIEDF